MLAGLRCGGSAAASEGCCGLLSRVLFLTIGVYLLMIGERWKREKPTFLK